MIPAGRWVRHYRVAQRCAQRGCGRGQGLSPARAEGPLGARVRALPALRGGASANRPLRTLPPLLGIHTSAFVALVALAKSALRKMAASVYFYLNESPRKGYNKLSSFNLVIIYTNETS